MKRYVHSSSNQPSLLDVLNRIEYFVVVDDCASVNLSQVNASDDIDEDDTEYLLSAPDNVLTSLSDEEIKSISDVGLLSRFAKLCKDRLSAEQLTILKQEFKKKIPLDDSTKQELLQLFKRCNRVIVERRKKNLDFIAEYNLSDNDILSILHNLKLSDFDKQTKSINYSHLGDDLIILNPKILIPQENIMIGANLYVKLDVDESKHSAAAFVSIHPENENQ